MECPFCDNTNLSLRKFYENENFIAIYNLRPFVEGHSLVLPKRHVKSLLDLNSQEKTGFMSFLDRVIFISLKYAEAHEFNLILQEGENAGQSIPHAHFHIMPRKLTDKVGKAKKEWLEEFSASENDVRKTITDEETERIVKKMRWIVKEHRIQVESF